MELTVLKSEIYREVEKRSSLEAAGLPDNFLYAAEGSLRAFQLDESGGRTDLSLELPLNNEAIRQLQSVGNTLVVYTDGGATYLLFKEGQYKVLGDELPEVFLQFS